MFPLIPICGGDDDDSRILVTNVDYDGPVEFDSSGNTYAADGPGTVADFIHKYDPSFTLLLSQTLSETGATFSHNGIAFDGTNVYLAGQYAEGGNYYASLYELDAATLATVGFAKYLSHGTNNVSTTAFHDVIGDGLGNVYCIGTKHDDDLVHAEFDNAGTLNWTREIGRIAGTSAACKVAYDSFNDRTVYAGGINTSGVVQSRLNTGSSSWTRALSADSSGGASVATAVCCDASGNTYVAVTPDSDDPFIVKFNSSGTQTASVDFSESFITGFNGLFFLDGSIFAIGDYSNGGIVIVELDTALGNTGTAKYLLDADGTMPLPTRHTMAFDGTYFRLNFGAFGDFMSFAKISKALWDGSAAAIFGNRFTLSAPFSPTGASNTLSDTAGPSASTITPTNNTHSGVSSASATAPTLTDYFLS